MGIVGLLTTTTDMIKNVAGLGLPFSGVRDISIADSNDDTGEVSKIVKIFNKWVFVSSLLGAFITILFCLPLSQFLFNNNSYAFGIAFLSISVFFSTISAGFQAVMQGKRSILMMVKSAIVANLISSILSIFLYLQLKEDGIVPSLIVTGFVNFAVTYYFYRNLAISDYGKISLSASWSGAKGMIKIGFFRSEERRVGKECPV